MSRDAVKTLFHPFSAAMLESPAAGARVLFLGAQAGAPAVEGFTADIVAVQPLRPLFNALRAQGIDATPELSGKDYDAALILCGKHRGENENRVTEALERVKQQGLVVIAGAKEDGILTLRKTLAKLGIEAQSAPKYHGVALWFRRPADIAPFAGLKARAARIDNRFTALPGMFSNDRIDAGSELLASRLPGDFDGNAADFGAGWGYLSVMLAQKSPRTARIDLFEADWNALEYAKANIAENCPDLTARFFWQDLANEPPKEKYDLVIMNPPFHAGGQAAEPALGQAMIGAAAGALRGGGKLMLVANRGLPYETVLATEFRNSGELCRNARFKVLTAQK